MRTVEQIARDILDGLELTEEEKMPGSDLHALAKAVAVAQQDGLVQSRQTVHLSEATGADLDDWGATFNLSRNHGEVAEGFCLALAEETVILPNQTVLTDLNSGLQFLAQQEKRLRRFVETKVRIQAVNRGRHYNLGAGVELFSPDYPEVQFLVGEYRSENGGICGELRGGRSREADDDFRARISSYIRNFKANSAVGLKYLLLNESDVLWVDTQTPLPGYLIVWVETSQAISQTRLNFLDALVNANKAAGVISEVRPINRKGLDFSIAVQPEAEVDLDGLSERLKTRLYEYLYSLSLNQNLNLASLKRELAEITGVGTVTVEQPSYDQIVEGNKVIRPNSVNVKYEFI
ncbi:MAG: baseplate J/gp47 family protein [Halobacteria archaeon]